jgi:YegS/Rv2252/BmrU family lipid kinase
MINDRYDVIVNVSASTGKGRQVWRETERILKREKAAYQAYFPKNSDETKQLVQKLTSAENGSCHLIVLGGDGTLNTVLQGIVSFETTKLSCIRTGSGNDFARNMKITKNTEQAMMHILYHPEETVLDYGELVCRRNREGEAIHRRFIISSGTGFDADICEEVSRSRWKHIFNKVHLGKLVYTAIGIKQIFTRKAVRATIRLDDAEPVEIPQLFFAVGMIHAFEGGGVPFCPKADPSDGLLDVCIVRNMPRWKLLLAVMLVYARQHYRFSEISGHRCKKMVIRTEKPQWFHMDGETPYRIRQLTLSCRSGLHFVK